MWAVMAALGHWMQLDDFGGDVCQTIFHVEDGERACQLIGLFGCAFLTALEAMNRAGKLTKDSDLRDLGLVMSLYLWWSYGLEGYGIEGDGVLEWRKHIVAYAKKAKIDLKGTGCHSAAKVLLKYNAVRPLKTNAKANRWDWQKMVSQHGNIDFPQHDR